MSGETLGVAAPLEDDEGNGADLPTAGISKSKQKKLLKQKRFEEKKLAKRAEAKQKKQEESQKRQAELQAMLQSMSQQEREDWDAKRAEVRQVGLQVQARRDQGQEKKARLEQAQAAGQQVVVDLGFDDLMTELELKSLAKQLVYCHSVNSRAAAPCHLIFTDFEGKIAEQLTAQSANHGQWPVTKHTASYADAFRDRMDKLVYLTADAAEELHQLDSAGIYIIGGLVDRNRHKNICQNKAAEQGIRTARLPIREHMTMTGTHVLTVNQVLALLLEYQACNDWSTALLSVLPGRKHPTQLPAAPFSEEALQAVQAESHEVDLLEMHAANAKPASDSLQNENEPSAKRTKL